MYYSRIVGTGSYTPQKVVTNDELSNLVDTSDEWITTRTGIKRRRISEGEDTSSLCIKASKDAINDANIDPSEIDLIIVATITPDNFTPSTSCLIQKEIGAINATCFDINAACTGFIYAINIANQFIKTGQSKVALVIGAEVLSKVTDWKDRSTCVLFGDGAGACIISRSYEEGIINTYTGSDGDTKGVLTIGALPVNNPYCDTIEKTQKIYMNGNEVFKFATKVMNKSIKKVLENTNVELNDVKYIIPHQANYRIIDYVKQKNKIDDNKFYLNLKDYGNTSSASIGIALDEMNKKNMLKKGDKMILVGFGGGLTWGSILLEWNK